MKNAASENWFLAMSVFCFTIKVPGTQTYDSQAISQTLNCDLGIKRSTYRAHACVCACVWG